jgi:thiamine-phosphate pyrophosphorylase
MRGPRAIDTLKTRLALHVLTDQALSRGRDTLSIARDAIAGGATVIQLRDKTASTRSMIENGLALRALTRQHNVLLIVNDRIDVALAVDADGAHVGQDDMPGEMARQLLGPNRILGISAATMEEATAAIAAGADYLGVGPIYATSSKGDAGSPVGLQLLQDLSKRYTTPLVAIGGIHTPNTAAVIQAGATVIAVISAVVSADDIVAATQQLIAKIQLS